MSFAPTLRRLASGIHNLSPSATAELAAELLPPLPLYRRLLRVHRKVLPAEFRVMGDDYVKAEFRRTRSTDNPLHIVGFLSEWKKYLDFHEAQLVESAAEKGKAKELEQAKLGQMMDPSILESLSADQIGQLYELFQATKDVYLSEEEFKAKLEAAGQTQEGIPAGQVLPDLASTRPAAGEGEEGEKR
ncbi:SPOSA6832_02805 [Sporobolomyces salmonicolor]|uniref:Succinate dehydrogenase assembly factor 3 n=1 Tax=Sporidiobolus salmonicolor TaxID=5005 RepID=A0A0D6EMX4_SPOSA|nr:SPOSA6832_02805 [Sporobolomyces salmonicolor]